VNSPPNGAFKELGRALAQSQGNASVVVKNHAITFVGTTPGEATLNASISSAPAEDSQDASARPRAHQSALSAPPSPIHDRQDLSRLLPELSPENRSGLRNLSFATGAPSITPGISHEAPDFSVAAGTVTAAVAAAASATSAAPTRQSS
jgi:hypothetical protein